jgi:hypothetical protein
MGEITLYVIIPGPSQNFDADANRIMTELESKGFQYYTHTSGTNTIQLPLKDSSEISDAVLKIKQLKDNPYFYIWPDPGIQLVDAITNHEYFKAFAICTSLYESIGKSVLKKYLADNNLTVGSDRINRFGVEYVLLLLYTYKLVDERKYLQMMRVNSIRNDLVHREPVGQISKELYEEINKDVGLIMITLADLELINK